MFPKGSCVWMGVVLCGVLAVLAGCSKDTNGEGAVAVDCGEAGELLSVEDEQYCVYERPIVVENGFRCPGSLATLTRFGPIGICSRGELERPELERLAERHRDRNPMLWSEAQCISDDECEGEEVCQDAVCEGAQPAQCPEGQTQVDGPEGCLQDDAVCEEIAPGIWCTGPDAPECPEGFEPVDGCFVDDVECIQISESLFCLRIDEGAQCPEGQTQVDGPENCLQDDAVCEEIAPGVWCTGPDAPEPAPCCCEFLEDDIIIEDLLDMNECMARDSGQCIEVDPDRLTPHPCCPDAQGERCGDG